MHIDYLGDHVEQLVAVSEWPMEDTRLDSAAERAEALGQRLNRSTLPLTLVALSGSAPIGVVSLVADAEPDARPGCAWLTDLFVPEELRGQGIGSALVRRAVEEAWELGFERLVARAGDNERFAFGLGWSPVATGDSVGSGERTVEIRPTHNRSERP